MNIFAKLLLVLVFISAGSNGFSQGTFQNLDFENPITPLNPVNGMVSSAAALPGWACYLDSMPVTQVYYNTFSLGAPAIGLQGPGSLDPIYSGNYCVSLQSRFPGGAQSAAIGQTAQIPPSTSALFFFTYNMTIQVTFNGVVIPTQDLGSAGGGYEKIGADISSLAGQTGELRFTSDHSSGDLDNISFSPQSIPEPAGWTILLCGAALTAASRRKSKN